MPEPQLGVDSSSFAAMCALVLWQSWDEEDEGVGFSSPDGDSSGANGVVV